MSFEDLKIILISLGLPEDGISLDTTREDAGLDSLAVVELALVLRREKGLAVTEEEIEAASTVGDVAALVGAR
jgi:acyl carrier protein